MINLTFLCSLDFFPFSEQNEKYMCDISLWVGIVPRSSSGKNTFNCMKYKKNISAYLNEVFMSFGRTFFNIKNAYTKLVCKYLYIITIQIAFWMMAVSIRGKFISLQ